MDAAWARLKADVAFAQRAVAPDDAEGVAATRAELLAAIEEVTARCREERAAQKASEQPEDLSDEALVAAARFVDHVPLAPFANVLHLTPRLVNVVTLAEAVPCPGSGVTLPLDLHFIASRCSNSYYAPRRFAAVQLAFSAPRARVLVFHTGRVVGTGALSTVSNLGIHFWPLRWRREHAQPALRPVHGPNAVAYGVDNGYAFLPVVACKLRNNIPTRPATAYIFFALGIPTLCNSVLDVPNGPVVLEGHPFFE